MILEKASMQDLKQVVRLFEDSVRAMEKQKITQSSKMKMCGELLEENIAKEQMYLLKMDDRIASVVVISQECDDEYKDGEWRYDDVNYAVVHKMCVSPYLQNLGIGKSTMVAIEELIQEAGIEAIRLNADAMNTSELHLYDTLGYERVGKGMWHKGAFYLMEKIL